MLCPPAKPSRDDLSINDDDDSEPPKAAFRVPDLEAGTLSICRAYSAYRITGPQDSQ
ncbi:hypothetical protein [Meiothermus cerbereus]|uniref:hypothetical protein n=1 Tax=Meiothermus cerbereus TaxID=65552 RepID=UPI000B13D16C|nr:hypothetical protein [Meiothermus cerbereus]